MAREAVLESQAAGVKYLPLQMTAMRPESTSVRPNNKSTTNMEAMEGLGQETPSAKKLGKLLTTSCMSCINMVFHRCGEGILQDDQYRSSI
jgi:hypothetical protein